MCDAARISSSKIVAQQNNSPTPVLGTAMIPYFCEAPYFCWKYSGRAHTVRNRVRRLTRRFGAVFNRDRMCSSARITSRYPPHCDQIALSTDTKIYLMKIQPTFALQGNRKSPWTNRFLDHAFAKRNVMLRVKFCDSTKCFNSCLDDNYFIHLHFSTFGRTHLILYACILWI